MAVGLSTLAELMAQANPCPHPHLLDRAKTLVSDGHSTMALCSMCYRVMRRLVERAEQGDRPGMEETSSALLALGYDPQDAQRFWEDLP
jgi:Holliday junction resolvasome RuvABC DNA-binding subunit